MSRTPSGPNLWLGMIRTTAAMDAVARQSMAAAGLGFSDFVLLEALLHVGPLRPSELGEKLALTSGSVTAVLDRLEARGLVSRTHNPADGRSFIVELTPSGRDVIGPAYEAHAADIEHLFSSALTAEQRRELFGLLRAVRRAATKETS